MLLDQYDADAVCYDKGIIARSVLFSLLCDGCVSGTLGGFLNVLAAILILIIPPSGLLHLFPFPRTSFTLPSKASIMYPATRSATALLMAL